VRGARGYPEGPARSVPVSPLAREKSHAEQHASRRSRSRRAASRRSRPPNDDRTRNSDSSTNMRPVGCCSARGTPREARPETASRGERGGARPAPLRPFPRIGEGDAADGRRSGGQIPARRFGQAAVLRMANLRRARATRHPISGRDGEKGMFDEEDQLPRSTSTSRPARGRGRPGGPRTAPNGDPGADRPCPPGRAGKAWSSRPSEVGIQQRPHRRALGGAGRADDHGEGRRQAHTPPIAIATHDSGPSWNVRRRPSRSASPPGRHPQATQRRPNCVRIQHPTRARRACCPGEALLDCGEGDVDDETGRAAP